MTNCCVMKWKVLVVSLWRSHIHTKHIYVFYSFICMHETWPCYILCFAHGNASSWVNKFSINLKRETYYYDLIICMMKSSAIWEIYSFLPWNIYMFPLTNIGKLLWVLATTWVTWNKKLIKNYLFLLFWRTAWLSSHYSAQFFLKVRSLHI